MRHGHRAVVESPCRGGPDDRGRLSPPCSPASPRRLRRPPGPAGWSGTGRTREDAPCPLASRSLRRGGDDPVSVENGPARNTEPLEAHHDQAEDAVRTVARVHRPGMVVRLDLRPVHHVPSGIVRPIAPEPLNDAPEPLDDAPGRSWRSDRAAAPDRVVEVAGGSGPRFPGTRPWLHPRFCLGPWGTRHPSHGASSPACSRACRGSGSPAVSFVPEARCGPLRSPPGRATAARSAGTRKAPDTWGVRGLVDGRRSAARVSGRGRRGSTRRSDRPGRAPPGGRRGRGSTSPWPAP